MRHFELELYRHHWTMTKENPTKIVRFSVKENPIAKAEKIGANYSEMRLWEFDGNLKEFVCSGCVNC